MYRLVRRDDAGRYTLTSTGELFCTDSETSARGLAGGFLGPGFWSTGSGLAEVVRGKKVDPAAPGGVYEFFGQHPEEAVWFARAMGRITRA